MTPRLAPDAWSFQSPQSQRVERSGKPSTCLKRSSDDPRQVDPRQNASLQRDFWQKNARIPPELGQLPNLALLNLGENQLSGSFPVALTRLNTSLAKLDVGQNLLTGELPIELGSMQELRSLRLGPNRFHGSIPKACGYFKLSIFHIGWEKQVRTSVWIIEGLHVIHGFLLVRSFRFCC